MNLNKESKGVKVEEEAGNLIGSKNGSNYRGAFQFRCFAPVHHVPLVPGTQPSFLANDIEEAAEQ